MLMTQKPFFFQVSSILLTFYSSVMLGYLNSGVDHPGQPIGIYSMLDLKTEEGKERTSCHLSGG